MVDPSNADLAVKIALIDLELRHQAADLAEIKESAKWMMRLIVGQFLTLVVGLIVFMLGRA